MHVIMSSCQSTEERTHALHTHAGHVQWPREGGGRRPVARRWHSAACGAWRMACWLWPALPAARPTCSSWLLLVATKPRTPLNGRPSVRTVVSRPCVPRCLPIWGSSSAVLYGTSLPRGHVPRGLLLRNAGGEPPFVLLTAWPWPPEDRHRRAGAGVDGGRGSR
jgi:hypothetical protein